MEKNPQKNIHKQEFFSYSWHTVEDDEFSQTSIRIYGVDRKNNNVCVRIENFTPYAYIELPENVEWTESNAQLVCTKIDNMTGDRKPIMKRLMFKKRLYYANLDENYNRKLYPYIFCNFTNTKDIAYLRRRISKPIMIAGIGCIKLKMHEYNASPILQLTSLRLLPPAGWISFQGRQVKDHLTYCDSEYIVEWKNISDAKDDSVGRPLLMGFDCEVNSSNPSAMPNAGKPDDKVFQISCVFARQGSKDIEESILLTLGRVDESMLITEEKEQIQVRYFETEHDLLLGFKDLIQEKQPNIIIGYNIFNFDIPYMIKRSEYLFCQTEFAQQGMNIGGVAQKKIIDWSSSAYKNQKFEFLDAEGRIFVDLLPLVKRDYKFANYRLKTIAEFFLKNKSKDPLDPKGIFKCYRLGMKGGHRGEKALAVVGKYCVKDSELVVRLFEVMKTWVGLCEMSKVTNVPVFQLYTQGQQLKIFSSTYKKCTHENTIVENEAYVTKADDHYVGATVFPPVPGLYHKVVSGDFSSLYPSVIIAYNLCWSTLVLDSKIPDEKCYVMEWEDHIGCEHDPKMIRVKELEKIIKNNEAELKILREERDKKENKHRKEDFKLVIAEKKLECKPYRDERSELKKSKPKHTVCAKRKYRWLKSPMGVLPEILTHLISSRKVARKQLEEYEKQRDSMVKGTEEYEKISTLIEVMDKRQLALKVSANSMYGATGVRKGYLPIMPVAMCTTYKGRLAVQLAADSIQNEYGGKLVYGDSVTGDTPIMIKHSSGKIEIKRIDELANTWKPYPGFKAYDKTLQNKEQSASDFSVWTGDEWSKIKRVIRHNTLKNIYRVSTPTGCIDVTEDHSLMSAEKKMIKPQSLKKFTKLWHSFPYKGGDIVENKRILCKDKIQAQNVFLQCKLQRMKPTIILENDKIYIDLSGENNNYEVKVKLLGKIQDYVYDLETEKGVFHGGIGELIVKNTDSNYVTFPHIKTPEELWEYAMHVTAKVSEKFPKPMKIAFEDVIYWKYFIITKKRYMSINWKKGQISDKISKKGVLLQRRDNCNLIRKIYGDVIMGIFNEASCENILYNLVQDINNMCAHVYPTSEFIVTKSVGDPGTYSPKQVEEEKDGKPKIVYKIGDYAIQPRDILTESNRTSLFKKKDHHGVCTCYNPNHTELNGQEVCDTCKGFYLLCLPAQAQLAEKMRQRGRLVAPGTRLEYVITSNGGPLAKQSEKIEPDDYFIRHSASLELDYLYYLKQMANPIDQVLNIMFLNKPGIKYQKDFVLNQYKYRLKVREKVLQDIKNLFKRRIQIMT